MGTRLSRSRWSWILLPALFVAAAFLLMPLFLDTSRDASEGGPRDLATPTSIQAPAPALQAGPASGPALDAAGDRPATPKTEGVDARTLRGHVLDDATGVGIAGVKVIAFGESVRVAVSGTDGAFELTGLKPGSWRLLVWHPGYVPPGLEDLLKEGAGAASGEAMRVEVPGGSQPLAGRVIRLQPGRRIEGRVVDGRGNAVAGALIRIKEGDWSRTLRRRLGFALHAWEQHLPFRSDPAGRFVLACLPAAFSEARLGATGEGVVSRWSDAIPLDPAQPPAQVELRLLATATVSGRVREPDGAPPVRAAVEVNGAQVNGSEQDLDDIWAWDGVVDTDVGAEGRYTITGLPPGRLGLEAYWLKPYLAGVSRGVSALGPGEHRRDVDLSLVRRHVLRIRLVDGGGQALSGERVAVRELRLDKDGNEEEGVFNESDETDESGLVELAISVDGPVAVTHVLPSGLDRVLAPSVALPVDECTYVTQAAPKVRIELRVMDLQGGVVPRFRSKVWSSVGDEENQDRNKLDFDSYARGSEGVAVHEVMGAAPFVIRVSAAADAAGEPLPLAALRLDIETVPADGVVTVQLGGADEVRGRIVDAAGHPVPGGGVSFAWREYGGARRRGVRTIPVRADGRFAFRLGEATKGFSTTIEVLVPEGYLAVRPYKPDPEEGERVLVLRRGGVLAGRVHAAAPLGPLEDGSRPTLLVSWEGDGASRWLEAPISEDGHWRAVGVPLGLDLQVHMPPLTAMHYGYRPPPAQEGLRAGRAGIEIRLVPGMRIAGRYLDPEGRAPRGKFLLIAVALDPDASAQAGLAKISPVDGSFAIAGVSPGRYRLYLRDQESMSVVDQRVVEAGREGLSITLPKRGSIAVRVEGDELGSGSIDVWVSGTTTECSSPYCEEGSWPTEIKGLPGDRTYDVVVRTRDGRVGIRGGVRIGDELTIRLVASKPLNGTLRRANGSEEPFLGHLYALTEGGCFDLWIDEDGTFNAHLVYGGVAPGRYELRYLSRDRTTHVVVARDVEAGSEDLDLVLK